MFDAGFFELILIAVIALVVVGPDKLPGLARKAGMWIGRGRRMVNSIKDDIEKEIKAEELKKVVEAQNASNPLHEIIEDTKSSLDSIKSDTETVLNDADKKLKEADSSDKDKS